MDPDERTAGRRAIPAEALGDVLPVSRLLAPAPPQPQRQQRQREVQDDAVQGAQHHASRGATSASAASTSATGGGRAGVTAKRDRAGAEGTGPARVRAGVDAHDRHAQRDREVHEPGVEPRHGRRMADQPGGVRDRHARRDHGVGEPAGEPLGTAALRFGAPGQHADEAARLEYAPELDPRGFAPQLRRAGGGVEQHAVGRDRCERRGWRRYDAVIDLRRQRVTEHPSRETAIAFDRMDVGIDIVGRVVEPRCERLAHGGAAVAVHRSACELGDDRALQQPLRVDHRVVRPVAQRVAKRGDLAPHGRAREAASPAPQRKRDRVRDARMHLHQRKIGLLDDPLEHGFGPCADEIRNRGEGVQDVAERRQTHEQDSLHSCRARVAGR